MFIYTSSLNSNYHLTCCSDGKYVSLYFVKLVMYDAYSTCLLVYPNPVNAIRIYAVRFQHIRVSLKCQWHICEIFSRDWSHHRYLFIFIDRTYFARRNESKIANGIWEKPSTDLFIFRYAEWRTFLTVYFTKLQLS